MKLKDLSKIGVSGDYTIILSKTGLFKLSIKGYDTDYTSIYMILNKLLTSNLKPIVIAIDEINEYLAYNDEIGYTIFYRNCYLFSDIKSLIIKCLNKKKFNLSIEYKNICIKFKQDS